MICTGKKCIGYGCQKIVYKQMMYTCCSRQAYLCSYCRTRKCDSCKEAESVNPSMQAHPAPSPPSLFLRMKGSAVTERCPFCPKKILSHRIFFRQVNCDVAICYSCLYDTYCNFCSKTAQGTSQNKQPSPNQVQLPCGCCCPETQVVSRLNAVCNDCQKSITSGFFLMENQARLCKECSSQLMQLRQNSWTGEEEKPDKHTLLALKKKEKLLLSCAACSQNLVQTVIEVNSLKLCVECANQAQIAESSLLREQQESIVQTPFPQPPKVAKTRQCTICSRIYEIGQNTIDLCQACATGNQNEEKIVDENQSAQKHGEDRFKTNEAGEIHHTKMDSKNVMKDEQNDMDILSQKNEDSSQKSQKKIADPYEMPRLIDPEEEMRQCSQCLILFEKAGLLNVFEKKKGSRKSVRIASEQGQLEKETTHPFCLLCYFDLKYSNQEEKNFQQNFIPQDIQLSLSDGQQDLEKYIQISDSKQKNQKECEDPIFSSSSEGTSFNCQQKKYEKAGERKCNKCRRQKESHELVNGICQSCDQKKNKREEIIQKDKVSFQGGLSLREGSGIPNSVWCVQCRKSFKKQEMIGLICRDCVEKMKANQSAASGKKKCSVCKKQMDAAKEGRCEYCSRNPNPDE